MNVWSSFLDIVQLTQSRPFLGPIGTKKAQILYLKNGLSYKGSWLLILTAMCTSIQVISVNYTPKTQQKCLKISVLSKKRGKRAGNPWLWNHLLEKLGKPLIVTTVTSLYCKQDP